MHTPPRPEKETPYPQPGPALPSTPPIPVPPPRPKVPPRLNRTTSLPAHKQPTDVSGYVMKAMEELKQLNICTPEQSDGPNKEKEVGFKLYSVTQLDMYRVYKWGPPNKNHKYTATKSLGE